MNINKVFYFILLMSFLFMNALISQSIEIVSYGENPLVVNPLIGSDLTVNFMYSSEDGSSGNHIFIGL